MNENALHHPLLADPAGWAEPALYVGDAGQPLRFAIQDAFNYHGYDAPGGVVLGFRLLQRAFALLEPSVRYPDRHGLSLVTPFPGLGVKDVMELVCRMVTGSRYTLDPGTGDERAQDGVEGRFYYRFTLAEHSVELAPALGHPGTDFIRLGRASKRPGFSPVDAEAWQVAKFNLANTLLTSSADDVVRVL